MSMVYNTILLFLGNLASNNHHKIIIGMLPLYFRKARVHYNTEVDIALLFHAIYICVLPHHAGVMVPVGVIIINIILCAIVLCIVALYRRRNYLTTEDKQITQFDMNIIAL